MHLIRLILFLVICIELNESGLMDRFKSSYNWISKVDYKVWQSNKKDNSTSSTTSNLIQNTTLDSLKETNQTESSVLNLSKNYTESSISIANQTESLISSTANNQKDSKLTINFTSSNLLVTTTSLPTTIIDQINISKNQSDLIDEDKILDSSKLNLINESVSNEKESTKQNEYNKPVELTTLITLIETNKTTSSDNSSINNSLASTSWNKPIESTSFITLIETNKTTSSDDSSINNSLALTSSNATTELVNLPSLAITTNIPTEFLNTITESPKSLNVTKLERTTTIKYSISDDALEATTTSLSSIDKQPVELNNQEIATTQKNYAIPSKITSTESIKAKNQTLLNHTVNEPITTTESNSIGITTLVVQLKESTTLSSSTKSTKKSKFILKSNTPIVVKFLNLKSLTPGSRRMKDKEGENDNIIYKDIHTYNFLKEKLDEAFVKFINTFYFGYISIRRN